MTAALDRHGFISLYMVGARAMSKRRPQDTAIPYEFVTFGETRQPTPELQAELESILKAPAYVRVMADMTLETSANYLNNMLVVIDGGLDDSNTEGQQSLHVNNDASTC
ncbi:hypothetical protein PSUB009319_43580 [Ralstonia sp. SET104]|nr:hypothetical protein PSUB009319_43580 [Ralstonia sp. SET104]